MTEAKRDEHAVVVWDLPVRLFHWATVLLMPALYLTGRWNLMGWHARAGEALLALVLFRLLWGFFGSETARFARFVASPGAALRHLAHFRRRAPVHRLGHNPAGGWMVMLLLALLLGQTLSGVLVQNDVADNGPFTDSLPAVVLNGLDLLHTSWLWTAILVAAGLHSLAVLAYALVPRENLLVPMVTGRKSVPASIRPPRIASSVWALALLGSAGGLTAILVARL